MGTKTSGILKFVFSAIPPTSGSVHPPVRLTEFKDTGEVVYGQPNGIVQFPLELLAEYNTHLVSVSDSSGRTILRTPSVSVDLDESREVVAKMSEKLDRLVGLASNQINQAGRIIALRRMNGDYQFMIDPVLYPVRDSIRPVDFEGCGSIPGLIVSVERYRRVGVSYTTIDGAHSVEALCDLEARIAQHEVDHLNGILITDRAEPNSVRWKQF